MDKPRGVRRGPSRFSTSKLLAKQSGHKLCDGLDGIEVDFEFPLQTKKEKVRSLNAVGRALSSFQGNKMGCGVTAKVGELRVQSPSLNTIASSKKRFKVSKRFSDDGNGVGHASVPRKLRSAVKKRNREYNLPDSEKLNHKLNGMESPVKKCIQKTKVMSMQQGNPDWSTRQTVSGPITKDEEEVVETLYALSGMFLNNVSNERLKLQGDSSPENSNLQDLEKSTNNAFEGPGTDQDSHPFHSHAEISSGEAAITNSSADSIDRKQPDSVENAELMTSDNFASNLNLDTMPMLIRNENGNDAALDDSELSLAVGLSMPRQSPNLRNEMKPEPVGAVESIQIHHMMKDQSDNGVPTLWPVLALAASAERQASYLQSSAAKAPVRPDTAKCASKQDSRQGASSEISEVVVRKKLWKRCAAHVYISNFIRSLQVSNNKDALKQVNHSNQLRVNEGSVQDDLMEVPNSNRTRSEITSAPGLGHSDTAKDLHDNRNSIHQHSCCYHEALTPDVYGTQKQGLDLLSLSVGGNELKVNNKLDQSRGRRLESLPKLQMHYFQSLAQLQGIIPFPVPQSQYASPSSLTHQISAAGPQVLPHYYGNSLWLVGRNGSTASSNKHQQQSSWGVHQVAVEGQGRSGINYNIMGPQHSKWENGRQGSAVNPAMTPQSSASLQVVGSKFPSISEQQQQHFMSLAPSLPQSRTNGLNNFVVPPSASEQSRGRFHSSRGTLSLQLLGDER